MRTSHFKSQILKSQIFKSENFKSEISKSEMLKSEIFKFQIHGFASVMAVVLLGLVSLAAFSIFAMLAADARRTSNAQLDAQLRQMLFAGAADVTARSKSWDEKAAQPGAWNVQLPAVLTRDAGGLRVSTKPANGGSTPVLVEARLQRRAAYETLTLAWGGSGWEVRSCQPGR